MLLQKDADILKKALECAQELEAIMTSTNETDGLVLAGKRASMSKVVKALEAVYAYWAGTPPEYPMAVLPLVRKEVSQAVQYSLKNSQAIPLQLRILELIDEFIFIIEARELDKEKEPAK